jgi:hypothetical protein
MEMMKRSFGENVKFSQLPRVKEKIKSLKKELIKMKNIECPYIKEKELPPMESYF